MINAKFSRLTLIAVVILAGCGKHEEEGAGWLDFYGGAAGFGRDVWS